MNCHEAQAALCLLTARDRHGTRPDPLARHVESCAECRAFAHDVTVLGEDAARVRATMDARIAARAGGAARVRESAAAWAREESAVGARGTRRRRDPNASEPRSWWRALVASGGGEGSPRLLLQGVLALGAVLFISFVVHFALSRRMLAEKAVEPEPAASSRAVDVAPEKTETPLAK
jgi:hypothetical protein